MPADHFCQTLSANVDNEKLSDRAFRKLVRNTLPNVDYPRAKTQTAPRSKKRCRTKR